VADIAPIAGQVALGGRWDVTGVQVDVGYVHDNYGVVDLYYHDVAGVPIELDFSHGPNNGISIFSHPAIAEANNVQTQPRMTFAGVYAPGYPSPQQICLKQRQFDGTWLPDSLDADPSHFYCLSTTITGAFTNEQVAGSPSIATDQWCVSGNSTWCGVTYIVARTNYDRIIYRRFNSSSPNPSTPWTVISTSTSPAYDSSDGDPVVVADTFGTAGGGVSVFWRGSGNQLWYRHGQE
jgi:hypothetical protein